MRITQIDTVTLDEFPNLLFIEIHRDAGFTGLGETFFGAPEVATYIHASAAPRLLGADATTIEALRVGLRAYLVTRGTGVERSGNSAIDIALWDLFGKATGRPICQLLGGASREAVRS